jgi:hypothetical protein
MTATATTDIHPVQDEGELRAVQRFKYDVYVDEMGRYGDVADHANRLLIEPDDATSTVFVASVDGELAGTFRLTTGAGISLRQIDQYDLAPFLATLAPDRLVVGERFMIAPAHRGSKLLFHIFSAYMAFVNQHRIQLLFGDCEPHLLNTYQALGFRTYTARHVNSSTTGYLIPLVLVAEDVAYLARIGSPLAAVTRDFGADTRTPSEINRLLAGGEAVKSEQMLQRAAFLAELKTRSLPDALASGLFRDMTEDEIAACIEKSVIIACRPGDRVIKEGNPAKNMSMVLSGRLEVRNGEEAIATLTAGDVFGEIAFFLKLPRTRDVVAVEPGTKIVSFNDRRLRQLIEGDAEIAAKLLLNVTVMLCGRLDNMNRRV